MKTERINREFTQMNTKVEARTKDNIKGKTTGVFLVTIGLFYALAGAWPCPPCPDCYHITGTYPNCGCGWDCSGLQVCCDGSCCEGLCCNNNCLYGCDFCCGSTCCTSPETCCDNTTCCSPGEDCCDGQCCHILGECCNDTTCCTPGEDCCDDTLCCDDVTEECCNGTCCNKSNEACCHNNTCCGFDEICCDDGSCVAEPCDITEGEVCEASDTTYPCGCITLTGMNCENELVNCYKVYSNATAKECSGGCPGDCSEDDQRCWIEYGCSGYITLVGYKCLTPGSRCETGSSIVMLCKQCNVNYDDVIGEHRIANDSCN